MLRVRRDKLPLLVAAVGAVLPTLGYAQISNWTFNGGGGNWTQSWNQNTNWSPNTAFPNAATSNAIFAPGILAAGAGGSGTVQILTAVTVNTIRVQPTGTNSNAYNFLGAGTLNVVGNGTIEVTPGGTGGNQAATFANSIQTPFNSTTTKIGTGIAVFSGNNNFGSGSLSTFSVDQGTAVFSGANAANGLFIIGTNNDGVIELNNATVNAFGGLGSTVPVANGMIHATGNSTWNGIIFVTRTAGSIGADAGVTLNVNGSIVDGENTAINGFSKVGGTGTVSVSNLTLNGPLAVEAGRLKVTVNGTNTGTSRTSSLSIAGGTTPTASLDLTDNDLVVDYAGTSPLATIKAQIKSAYAGGAWSGQGLTTSKGGLIVGGPFNGKTGALGYAERTDIGNPASFSGVALTDSTAVLIKYTLAGDADLDGDVDGNDVAKWAVNFTGELGGVGAIKNWVQGDWDYDGDVDGNDVAKWAVDFTGELGGAGLGPIVLPASTNPEAVSILEGMGLSVSVVPEPASLGLLGFGVLGMFSRRRRR